MKFCCVNPLGFGAYLLQPSGSPDQHRHEVPRGQDLFPLNRLCRVQHSLMRRWETFEDGEEENEKWHGATGRKLICKNSTTKCTWFPTKLSQRLPAKIKGQGDKILPEMVAEAIGLKTAQIK